MIEALLNYQTADAKLRKIEKTLADSEERKKAMSAKKYLEGVEENVNKLDVRASELLGLYEQMTDEQLKLKEQENEIVEETEATDEATDAEEVSETEEVAEDSIIVEVETEETVDSEVKEEEPSVETKKKKSNNQ